MSKSTGDFLRSTNNIASGKGAIKVHFFACLEKEKRKSRLQYLSQNCHKNVIQNSKIKGKIP